MDVRDTGSWDDHKNYYSYADLVMFEELLPTLLSSTARKMLNNRSIFFNKEQEEMMERFKKEFGGPRLKIGGEK